MSIIMSQSLEKQLEEARADLLALGSKRKGAEVEQEELLEDLEELRREKERIDVSAEARG